MALVDSGAGDSFINDNFVRSKNLTLSNLSLPFACRSFDGSPASSGDVTQCWTGRIAVSDFLNHSVVSSTSLHVISLSTVDVILGLPWLKANHAWVGGSSGQLYFSPPVSRISSFPTSVQSLSVATITNNLHLNQDEILSLPSQLRSFADVFTVANLQSLPPVRPHFDLKIQLKDGCTPPFGGLYNLSESERRQLRSYIDENLSKGFIRLSSSPAAAPIFFVKTDGKDDRPCVDYRGINSMTVRDSYPIPVLSLLLNNLAGCHYLSKVDLKSAFNLLRVTPGQEYLTAFRTPWGLFEYMVMPFGLANAPATFQRFIQHVLREFIDVCCFVYIDDILIFSKTKEDHILHLSSILSKLREFSLKASLKKCQFFQTEVQFLGFIISSQGLRMDPKKLDTIIQWPMPETLKGLRRFLGFCNFYRRFIPRFSNVTSCLTELTKESVFHPSRMKEESSLQAFNQLKSSFKSAPLLSHFSFELDRIVHVDSSGYAIAGVLSQPDKSGKLHPVSFFSRKLTDQERVWPIFDLELFAVVSAFEEWRAWLAGTQTPVLVFSDHANLKHFMTSKIISPKQARWAAFLDSFNFKLIHVSGTANPADGPSRRPDFDTGNKLFAPNSLQPHFQIHSLLPSSSKLIGHDLYFQPVSPLFSASLKKSYDTLSSEEKEDYIFQDGLYWFRHRVLVPSSLREEVIRTYHEGPEVGHPGIARTLSLILRTFDWPSIRKDVISFVKSCDSCQRVKVIRQHPTGLLQPLPVPDQPWSVVGMDFIVKLPLSQGFDSILVIIDLLSKATHFIPCNETMTAKDLAKIFRREFFRLHGLPDRIISDRGTLFTSEFWQSFMQLLNITSAMSTAFHPQTDGQTERMNHVLEDYLRHFVSYNQSDWSEKLDLAEFSLNNLHSTSSGVSPFFFIHGYHPRFNTLTKASNRSSANTLVCDLQDIQESASSALQEAKKKQALYYNKARRVSPVFEPGDLVLLSRRNIQTRRANSKLDYRHLGPFRVLGMVGSSAVKLDILESYPKLHPVFNLSLVTPYKDPFANRFRSTAVNPAVHDVSLDKIDWTLFSEVLDHRTPQKGTEEYMIRWKHSTPAQDRWLRLQQIPRHLHTHLLSFHRSNDSAIPLLLTGIR
jgi:transposase InsO family protein